MCVCESLSHVWLFEMLGTIARSAPPSMGFPRQEYWSGLPFRPPGDLPNPGIEPGSPALQADSLPLSHKGGPTYNRREKNHLKTLFDHKYNHLTIHH